MIKKIKIISSILFFVGVFFMAHPTVTHAAVEFITTNAECDKSCRGDGSSDYLCGGRTGTWSCSGPVSYTTVNLGNGYCYDKGMCTTWIASGKTFTAGYAVAVGVGAACACEYNGVTCQSIMNSPGPIWTPQYACGGGGGGSGTFTTATSTVITPVSTYFTFSVSPTTATVYNGDTTTYRVTVTPTIDPNTGLGDGRAVGRYTLPTPIPGCPTGATCTYYGPNTLEIRQDTTSYGVDFAVPENTTVLVTPSTVTPGTYSLNFSATNQFGQTLSASANLIVSAPSGPPPMPSNLVLTCPSPGTTVNASWTYPAGWNTAYLRANPGANNGTWPSAVQQDTIVGNTTSFASTNGQTYYVWMHTRNPHDGSWSNQLSANVTCPTGAIANLSASPVTPTSASAGTPATFSSIISNNGNGSTGQAFSNFFQVANAINGGGSVTDLTSTQMSTLAADSVSTATSPSYTFPSAGTYSVRACADKTNSGNTGTISESNESDNCGAWTTVTVTAIKPTVTMLGWGNTVTQANANAGPIYMTTTSIGGLTWTSTNATTCEIYRNSTDLGPYPTSGTAGVGPDGTTAYTHSIICTGPGGASDPSSVTHLPPPTASMSAPSTATVNTPFTVSWSSTDATSVILTSSVMPPAGCTISPPLASTDLNSSRSVTCSTTGAKYFQIGVWNPIGTQAITGATVTVGAGGTSAVIGKVCKDDNGNGTCDTGEVYVRDTSLASCTNATSGQTGFSIGYSGPQNGSTLLNVCGGLGDPIFSATSLLAGSYNVTLTMPSGWTATKCLNSGGGVYTTCSSNTVGTVSPLAGETQVVLFYAKQATGASFTVSPSSMSFSGTSGGSTPAAQVMQTVSNGTSDVWYTASSDKSWCKINGSTSITGAVGATPAGQSSPVLISVDAPSVVGAGTFTCTITVTDPNSSPTTRTMPVTYTVSNATTYTVTVDPVVGGRTTSGDGGISCGTTCSHTYSGGTTVVLTTTPTNTQWKFVGWSGDCSGINPSISVSATSNKHCIANYKPQPFQYKEF